MKSRKILSLLLTIAMVLSVVMPTGVFAEDTATTENYGFVINDNFDDGTACGWVAGAGKAVIITPMTIDGTGEKVIKLEMPKITQAPTWAANGEQSSITKGLEDVVAFTGNNLIRIKARIKNAAANDRYLIRVNRPNATSQGLPLHDSLYFTYAVTGINGGKPFYGGGISTAGGVTNGYKNVVELPLKADGSSFDYTNVDLTGKWIDYTVIINGATNEQTVTASFEHNGETVTLVNGAGSTFLQPDTTYSLIDRTEEKTFEAFERLTLSSYDKTDGATLYVDSVSVENLPLTNIKAEVVPNDGVLIYKPETLDVKFNGDINYTEASIVIRNKTTGETYTNGTYDAATKTYTANFGGMLSQGDYELDLTGVTPVDHLPSDGSTPVFENTVIDFRVYTSKPPTLNNVEIQGRLVPDTGVLSVKSYDFQVENDTEGVHHYQWLMSDTIDGIYTEIPDETNSTLSVTEALATKYIKLRMSVEGSFSGFISNTVESNALIPEEKPVIKNLSLSTTLPMEGTELSAVYTYEDVNGDEENGTVIKWYVSDTAAVDDLGVEVETGNKYEITAIDNGKYVYCTVLPKNNFEYLGEGDLYTSQKIGPVFNKDEFLESTNLLLNPGFEDGLNHYSASEQNWSPNIDLIYGEARTGDISMRLYRRDTEASLHGVWGQDVAVELGKRYVAGCYAKSVDSSNRTIQNFYAYGSGFNLLDTDVNGEDKSKVNVSYLKFHQVVSAVEATSDIAKVGFTSFTSRSICDANVDDLYFGELYISDINTNYVDQVTIPKEGEKRVPLTNGEIYNQLGTQHGLYDQTVVIEIPATTGVYVDGNDLVITEAASVGTVLADVVVRPSYSGALQAEVKETLTIDLLSHGDSAPRATNVVISGTFGAGNTLSGTYNFLQVDGKADNSIVKWLYSDTYDGTYNAIPNATALNYTIDSQYADKFICMEVTPIADDGSVGTPVHSNILTKDLPPFMESITVEGDFKVGGTIVATGTAVDYNGIVDISFEFQWYVGDSAEGAFTPVAGQTSQSFVLDSSHVGKYIKVGIVPIVMQAPSRGDEYLSDAYAGPAVPVATNVSITKSGLRLTAQYTYTHIHGIKEKDTTFEWLVDGRCVSTTSDYTINFEGTKTITLAITPRAESEPYVGETVYKTITLTGGSGSTGGSGGGGYTGGGGSGGGGGGASSGGSVSGVTSVNGMTLTDPSKEVPETKSDIRGHWGETYIKEMESNGVMTADENGNFNPDKNVSRESMLTFLFKALKLEATEYKNEFNDITDGDFAKMLQTMVDNGTIAKDENFRPNDTITREEMCKILYVSLKNAGKLIESDAMVIEGFEDFGAVSDWAKVYVNAIYSNKIMVGISDTHFDPKGTVTKAQAATMLVRINRLIEGGAEK